MPEQPPHRLGQSGLVGPPQHRDAGGPHGRVGIGRGQPVPRPAQQRDVRRTVPDRQHRDGRALAQPLQQRPHPAALVGATWQEVGLRLPGDDGEEPVQPRVGEQRGHGLRRQPGAVRAAADRRADGPAGERVQPHAGQFGQPLPQAAVVGFGGGVRRPAARVVGGPPGWQPDLTGTARRVEADRSVLGRAAGQPVGGAPVLELRQRAPGGQQGAVAVRPQGPQGEHAEGRAGGEAEDVALQYAVDVEHAPGAARFGVEVVEVHPGEEPLRDPSLQLPCLIGAERGFDAQTGQPLGVPDLHQPEQEPAGIADLTASQRPEFTPEFILPSGVAQGGAGQVVRRVVARQVAVAERAFGVVGLAPAAVTVREPPLRHRPPVDQAGLIGGQQRAEERQEQGGAQGHIQPAEGGGQEASRHLPDGLAPGQ